MADFTAVTCWPSWHPTFTPLAIGPQITVFSGCGVNAQGNVGCAPEKMRANAEAQLQKLAPSMFSGKLSLDTYSLARYMQSEVGSGTIEERVAVGEAAINQMRASKRTLSQMLMPNGFYGPIHGSDTYCTSLGYDCTGKSGVCCAPYKRWAATTRDPTVLTLLLADFVMRGDSNNFSRGAVTQWGPEAWIKQGPARIESFVRNIAATSNYYWVGPLPGVDPWHTFLVKQDKTVPAASLMGEFMIMQGMAGLQMQEGRAIRPSWPATMPVCAPSTTRAKKTSKNVVIGIIGVAGVAGLSVAALRVAKNLASSHAASLGRRRR